MGGPGEAFLLPHGARSAPQAPLPWIGGAKGKAVEPEGLPSEQQWASETGERCVRGRGPRDLPPAQICLP